MGTRTEIVEALIAADIARLDTGFGGLRGALRWWARNEAREGYPANGLGCAQLGPGTRDSSRREEALALAATIGAFLKELERTYPPLEWGAFRLVYLLEVSQVEAGKALGVSQPTVSRLTRRPAEHLTRCLRGAGILKGGCE